MLPNFFLIGAGKSGTTSMMNYLDQHPDVFMCRPKEPRFFCYDGAPPNFEGPGDDRLFVLSDIDAYEKLFEDAGGHRMRGDASTWYLTHSAAPQNIHRRCPDAKLIIILREPIERAFSHWLHLKREQQDPIDHFLDACREEDNRRKNGYSPHWFYLSQSRYVTGLRRYLALFPKEQIHVILYDDLRQSDLEVFRGICRFLGINDRFVPAVQENLNRGGVPRIKFVQRYFDRSLWGGRVNGGIIRNLLPKPVRRYLKSAITQANLRTDIQLSAEDRAVLYRDFEHEIDQLEELIGRDLVAWRLQN